MSPVEPVPTSVVYDVNVLVTAVASGNSPFRSWPSPPPTSGNPCADCVGIIVDAAEFALWLSPHILDNVGRVLESLFKWERTQVDAYVAVISEAAEHSGGGLLADVPRTVHDCPDHEDNLVLDLVAEVGALLVVSNDTDLLSMSPWRGTPVLTPTAFAAKVDAMRRHVRRRRRLHAPKGQAPRLVPLKRRITGSQQREPTARLVQGLLSPSGIRRRLVPADPGQSASITR